MIKKEFGVRIDLDDDQMMARVFAYAAQSSSGDLKQCANDLMLQLIPGQDETRDMEQEKKQTSAARVYRGQPISIETTANDMNTANNTSSSKTKKNVIYRGQRVP